MISSDLAVGLRSIYDERGEFAQLLEFLASRRRSSTQLVVDSLVQNRGLEKLGEKRLRRKTIIDFFRRLEAAGAGKLIVGRKRRKTRFHWVKQVSMIEAGRAARSSARKDTAPEDKLQQHRVGRVPELSHQFAIRPDFIVEIRLPADLSSGEADRLSCFVKALPFDVLKLGPR